MPIPKSTNGEMSFLDHLEELRWRIILSAIALIIAFLIERKRRIKRAQEVREELASAAL
jgi:Sec-independent protein secretion pathway component TatC